MVAGNGRVYRVIVTFFLILTGYAIMGYAQEGVAERARTMEGALDYQQKKLDVQRRLRQDALWSLGGEDADADAGTTGQQSVTLPRGYYERRASIRTQAEEQPIRQPAEGWAIEHHLTTHVSSIYDDNIFNDSDDERDDFIMIVAPQLRFDIAGPKLYLNTTQQLSARYYIDFAEDIYDYVGAAQLIYNVSPRLQTVISNTYSKRNYLKEIEGTDIFSTNQTIERIDYNDFFARGEYNLIRGGNSLWLEYGRNNSGVRNHGRNNNIDYSSQDVGLGFTHSLSPRTSLSPAYTFRTYANRKNDLDDYDANGLRLGFKHAFASVLKASGIVGFELRDYTNAHTEDTAFRTSIGLTSLFSRLTTIELDYDFDRFSSFTSTSQYDRSRFGVGLYHQLTPFIRTFTLGTYSLNDYESGRRDDSIDAQLGLDFTLGRRLITSLSYRFGKKDSTVSSNEYTDNVYMVNVKSIFW